MSRKKVTKEDVHVHDKRLRQVVLGVHSRQFRQVFDAANNQLLDTFGMEMVELPNKEKTTMRQKRGRSQNTGSIIAL